MTFAAASVSAIHRMAPLWLLRRRQTIQAFGRRHAAAGVNFAERLRRAAVSSQGISGALNGLRSDVAFGRLVFGNVTY